MYTTKRGVKGGWKEAQRQGDFVDTSIVYQFVYIF
jgi:hypothetical protein